MKQKLLFIITKSNWGGAQRYVYDLAGALTDHYEVAVALGGDGELAEKLRTANIRTIHIPGLQRDMSLSKELRALWQMSAIIRNEAPDILHVNSAKAGGLGTFLGRLHRVPRIIFTAHAWAFNEDRPPAARLLAKGFHWLTVLFSHTTICVSHAIQAQMDWPFVSHKMVVAHPGRTVPACASRKAARHELCALHPSLARYTNDVWIGTIAELHPIKRITVALQAMAQLVRTHPALRYVVIGDGECRAALTEEIAQRNLTEHVFLVGHIHEAARLLGAFDIFILPSKSESYGYVLLEAGLAQVPVVATDVGGIPDIVTHTESGLLVPPDDPAALSEQIDTLLRDTTRRTAYATSLHAVALHRSVAHMATDTIAIYRAGNCAQGARDSHAGRATV